MLIIHSLSSPGEYMYNLIDHGWKLVVLCWEQFWLPSLSARSPQSKQDNLRHREGPRNVWCAAFTMRFNLVFISL